LIPNSNCTDFINDNQSTPTNTDIDTKNESKWVVNLKNFDIEIVLFILPPDLRSNKGTLAFGFSLCPHSFLGSNSFACGHNPPDITHPYIGSSISKGILRLRPTTSHILLQMADLKRTGEEVIVDPCAGIGTIPVEAEQYQYYFDTSSGQRKNQRCVAMGGDLVLNNPTFTKVAGFYEGINRGIEYDDKSDVLHSANLMAWDAAYLPLRTNSADVVVSDLPFGQQCLSLNSLNQLLPLVFRECARILKPDTGRAVLLCGSPHSILASIEQLSGHYWKRPSPRVSPVNIGGIVAWVVRVDRNNTVFNIFEEPEQTNFLARVKKIAQKRDRVKRQRQDESFEQQTKRRLGQGL